MERSACVAEPFACCGWNQSVILPSIILSNTCLVTFWSPLRRLSAEMVTLLSGRMTMQACNHLIEHTTTTVFWRWIGLAEILDLRTPLKELCVRTDQSGSPIAQRRQHWSTNWISTCLIEATQRDSLEGIVGPSLTGIVECSVQSFASFDILFCRIRTWFLTLLTNSVVSLPMMNFSKSAILWTLSGSPRSIVNSLFVPCNMRRLAEKKKCSPR